MLKVTSIEAFNSKKAAGYYIASLISFLLALLSKEVAVIIPVLMVFYRRFFIDDAEAERSRMAIKFHYISWFLIITGVYLILRSHALNFQELGLFESKYFRVIFLDFHTISTQPPLNNCYTRR